MIRLEPVLIRIPPEHLEQLRELARVTRVPQTVYLREAVRDLLQRYRSRRSNSTGAAMAAKQVRQGDVFIERCESPKGAEAQEPEGGLTILARGEATGHHHSVAGPDAAILAKGAERFLRVTRATQLRHQEHAAIALTRGAYEITIQREYDPITMARTVVD